MSRSTIAAIALVFSASLGLAACGDGSAGATGTSGSSGTAASAVKDPSTVKIADSSLGKILVDGKGRTLYLFTADGKNTNSMKCDAQCLKLWPPMEGKPKAGAGADAKLINTTDVAGKTQATYAGHPLYYYAPDKAAGDVKGQGIDKVWYVIDAHGKAITKAVPAGSNDGGYGY
ncbi:hypothetical protein [Streptomyces sp. NPDC005408]|uniref:COG4315 family predicted lipoprotein n=1 Tax=Streptomyces sp. NPDC005408 TaxID=3155341 RepID=UPI0033B79103